MSDLALTKENKNALSLTNESKVSLDKTWDEATYSWDEAESNTWDLQGVVLTRESKNTVTLSNESKN